MFCPKCGTQNDDNAFKCVKCTSLLQTAAGTKIDNHLVLSILVTVLCCLPFGLVGVVYAAQVNGKAAAGDIGGAQESARKARLWSYLGLGIGLFVYAGYAIIAIGMAASEGGAF